MKTVQKPRPRASNPTYQAGLALGLIKSLGAEEAARCARRHRWDGVLTLVRAETGLATACAGLG